ncbi:MAG TPA: hypothetical protein PKY30_21775 [Myxococcota bacterium]|nr:hypothetical protein [Myxococcota bacterium]HND29706.1 hypothetical protein [Myxococcota bacterium]HNH49688.1 hypothetical protein [Myxococcota bacterium]
MPLLVLLACTPSPVDSDTQPPTPVDPTADWVPGTGPMVTVSGKVFEFGPSNGASLVGATIAPLEAPDYVGIVDEERNFSLEVPSGAPLSFVLSHPDFAVVQSATVSVEGGIDDLGFQVPTPPIFELMAAAARVDVDADRCQVATTVSSAESPPYGASGVGEPDAIVRLDPPLPDGAQGPIYFDYISDSMIMPDPDLSATTIDGGVLFGNLPTGSYRLVATKDGIEFTEPVVRCSPGHLINAAPPHGVETVR